MSAIPFALNEYDRAATVVWSQAVDGLIPVHSPWLAGIDREMVDQVRDSRVSIEGSRPLSFEAVTIDTAGTLPVGRIVAGDFDPIVMAIDAQATQESAGLEVLLMDQLFQVTDATGNVIDAAGQALTHELIMQLVERMDIEFDESGVPMFQFLVTPQSAAKFAALPEMSAEQDRAWRELIERKRRDWRARQSPRRLASSVEVPVGSTPSRAEGVGEQRVAGERSGALFALHEYVRASRTIAWHQIDQRANDHAPSLAMFPRVATENVRTALLRTATGAEVHVDPIRVHGDGRFDVREVVRGSFEDLHAQFEEASKHHAKRLVEYWESTVEFAPGVGGIHRGRTGLSWDSLMDLIEDAAIGFDDDGNPTFKVFAGREAPELGAISPAQERRLGELLSRKRQESYARRGHRRLS